MKQELSNRNRYIIFLTFIIITIICIFVTYNIGKKQDEVFKEDFQQYRYALKLIEESRFEESSRLLKPLAQKHAENHEILRSYGLVLEYGGNYEKAEVLLRKAQDINVYLIKDSTFLAQYGEVLYKLKDYSKAKVYLKEAVSLNPSEDILNGVNLILKDIEIAENY